MSKMWSHPRLSKLLLSLVVFGLPSPAMAADAEKVELQVWTIRATRSNQEISPELKPLAELLKKTFKFTGYKLVKTDSAAVEIKQPFKTKITLKIRITERQGKKDIDKLSTSVSLTAGRFQLFGGWKLKGDDVLIVAVSAK